MKFMEWNIHGQGNYNNLYKMPTKIITTAVGEKKPDVAVFLEYIEKPKCPLKQWLIDNGYCPISTKPSKSGNGVLIAVKKEYSPKKKDEGIEYLSVLITKESKEIEVIGMRILTQGKYKNYINREELFDNNMKEPKNDNFVMLFDANCGIPKKCNHIDYKYTDNNRKYYSYQYIRKFTKNNNLNFIAPGADYYPIHSHTVTYYKDSKEIKLFSKTDLAISSFGKVTIDNDNYDWSFLESKEYNGKTENDVLSKLENLPDHGILLFNIDI